MTRVRDIRPRELCCQVDKGLHDCHAIKALVKNTDDSFIRNLAPFIGIELPYSAKTVVFLLRVSTYICFLRGAIERL